jgi:mycothiol synthase
MRRFLVADVSEPGGSRTDAYGERQGTGKAARPQLQMVWPKARLASPPEPRLREGYRLRQFRPGDGQQYLELMAAAGFAGWDSERLHGILPKVIPDGFFVIEHIADGRIVATAMAIDRPHSLHPQGGELGWVAADPQHSGRGLGLAVCAAVTARFIAAGYREIYLKTDDFRLPALRTYLKLGYEPLFHVEGMVERWDAVQTELARRDVGNSR